MFAPIEVAKNAVVGFPAVRRLARARHTTGVIVDPTQGESVLKELTQALPTELDGLDVLELGPGQSLALITAAGRLGVRMAAFDVIAHVDDHGARSVGVDYRVQPDAALPWPDQSFDLVLSNSVLEHVRDPRSLLLDTHRALRPGGHHIAMIDLETHLGGRREPDRMYEFLRYSQPMWQLMMSRRSSWLNRLRLSEWRVLFREAGFEPVAEVPVVAHCGLDALREVPYLDGYSDEDVLTRRITVTYRRPLVG